MPYKLEKKGDKWHVINSETGADKGMSDTRAMAVGHMRALYAAESKGKKSYDGWQSEALTKEQANYNPIGASNNKACANCQWFNSPDGCLIVSGDISPTGLSDLWHEVVDYTPEPIPVNIMNWGAKSISVPDKIKGWFASLFGAEENQMEGLRPVYVTKDVAGNGLRATIVFSNNFEDRHGQIIPEVVQENYIDWVNSTGLYPEFQVYHLGSKSRWGQADCVTRSGNFMIASGPVDPGKEELAEAFARDPNTGVSNGYYALYTPGKKEFTAWYPFEISPLPLIASANVWMGNEHILIEEGYLMKDEYKSLLASKGLPPELIAAIDADINARSTQVTAQGVGSKDDTPNVVQEPEFLDKLAASIGTAIKTQLDPVLTRLDTLEAGQKALESKANVNADDALAASIVAKIGQLPQGFKASESPSTEITDPNHPAADGNLSPQFEYLDKALETALAQNGVGVNN